MGRVVQSSKFGTFSFQEQLQTNGESLNELQSFLDKTNVNSEQGN